VAAGHDEDHREEPGDRDRVEDRHPVGVDRREDAVEEGEDVQHEHRRQDPRRQDKPDEVAGVGPPDEARAEGEQQHRQGGPSKRALIGARVRVTQTGKEEGQDRRDERRTCALAHALW